MILIYLIIGTWLEHHSYVSNKQIAIYENPALCESAREKLNTFYSTENYLCVEEAK